MLLHSRRDQIVLSVGISKKAVPVLLIGMLRATLCHGGTLVCHTRLTLNDQPSYAKVLPYDGPGLRALDASPGCLKCN